MNTDSQALLPVSFGGCYSTPCERAFVGAFQPAQPTVGCFGCNHFGSLLSNSFQVCSWARGANNILRPRDGWASSDWGVWARDTKQTLCKDTKPGHTGGSNKYLLNMYSLRSSEVARAVRLLSDGPIWGKGLCCAFQDGRNFLGRKTRSSCRWQVDPLPDSGQQETY